MSLADVPPRVCPKCGIERPIVDFYEEDNYSPHGWAQRKKCKPCRDELREKRKADPTGELLHELRGRRGQDASLQGAGMVPRIR